MLTFNSIPIAIRSNAITEAAGWIPHFDTIAPGVPTPEERDTLEEEIDKAERRGALGPEAARVLREIYTVTPLA